VLTFYHVNETTIAAEAYLWLLNPTSLVTLDCPYKLSIVCTPPKHAFLATSKYGHHGTIYEEATRMNSHSSRAHELVLARRGAHQRSEFAVLGNIAGLSHLPHRLCLHSGIGGQVRRGLVIPRNRIAAVPSLIRRRQFRQSSLPLPLLCPLRPEVIPDAQYRDEAHEERDEAYCLHGREIAMKNG